MKIHNLNDTIAAISTGLGESGIGIVRLSGRDAFLIAAKLFTSKNGQKITDYKTHTLHYGWIKDKDKVVDEVLLAVMRSPNTFTKEDTIEINCHGGFVAMRDVLELVLKNGARLAEAGEFTKRAFLNGRIDLAQAEAVLDIIKAKTDTALEIGLEQLKGNLSAKVGGIREALLDVLTNLEAAIDFPEDNIGQANLSQFSLELKAVDSNLNNILNSSKNGKLLREGIKVVICGKPNVGKSSLLNALLKQERSIVTAVAGTTRDTIEEIIDIKGIPVRIVDTAGILKPRGIVEKKAVERSRKYIESADLALILFDASQKLAQQDKELIRKLKKKTSLAVLNKIDMKTKIEKSQINKYFKHVVEISAKKNKNIALLENEIVNMVYKGSVQFKEPPLVSNQRHIELLRKAEKLIAAAANSLDNKLSLEFVTQDIKEALEYLDIILGKVFSEDLLDKIFAEFCIGK